MINIAVLDYSDGSIYIYNITSDTVGMDNFMDDDLEKFVSERHELDQVHYMVTEGGIDIHVSDY